MPDRYTPDELNRLHDQAHACAERLRRAARDDFWRGADALLDSAVASTQRAAERFARRWQRHAAARRWA